MSGKDVGEFADQIEGHPSMSGDLVLEVADRAVRHPHPGGDVAERQAEFVAPAKDEGRVEDLIGPFGHSSNTLIPRREIHWPSVRPLKRGSRRRKGMPVSCATVDTQRASTRIPTGSSASWSLRE